MDRFGTDSARVTDGSCVVGEGSRVTSRLGPEELGWPSVVPFPKIASPGAEPVYCVNRVLDFGPGRCEIASK